MIKKKESYTCTSKFCRVFTAKERGERVPVIELNFLVNKEVNSGHKVYVDVECAKKLLNNLQKSIDGIESVYYPANYYSRLHEITRDYLRNTEARQSS